MPTLQSISVTRTMNERRALVTLAKKACTRCSIQKRRCDRAMPDCGLCTRLRQKCNYEHSRRPSWGQTPLPSPKPETSLGLLPLTSCNLKDDIVRKLMFLTPEAIFLTYGREIEPWFPVVSITRLRGQVSLTWNEISLDAAILCMSIVLLTTTPPVSLEDEDSPSDFKSLYLYTKSSMSLAEGLGVNSFLIVQSRILVTLFEVAHGFYPAAYISIGATARAAESLEVHIETDLSPADSLDNGSKQEERAITWSGILVLDRYIAMESGAHPPLTHYRSNLLHDIFKSSMCPTHYQDQDRASPKCRLARLFEASSLLDKIHTTLNNPTAEHAFNIEELILTVQTLINFETILTEEIGQGIFLHSGGLSLCNTALLAAFENGTKLPPSANITENCRYLATTSLLPLLSTITNIVELFTLDTQTIDFNLLPPFVIFMVYRTAAIVTNRLSMDNDSDEKMRKLKILRNFLKIVGKRWLGCERYLKILNDDTTPRTLKALEQR